MAQSDEAMGRVEFTVYEPNSGREIESGGIDVGGEDILVEEHLSSDNLIYYRKSIRLAGGYRFAMDEHPDRTPEGLKGFAMMALNDAVQTTSWEWFNVASDCEATKLQEGGRLAIKIGQSSCGWEVIRTEFLTDVSLRLTRYFGDPMEEPFWRTTIRQGSWVAWPPGCA